MGQLLLSDSLPFVSQAVFITLVGALRGVKILLMHF